MAKPDRYQLVEAESAEALGVRVSELMEDGWRPFEKPFSSRKSTARTEIYFYQAMTCDRPNGIGFGN
jgi:hypothetical protein